MSTMTDAEKFLQGSGAKSATFPEIGATVTGTVIDEPIVQQQKDISTGNPKFWADGNPAMQLVIKVQTDERDPDDNEDDGTRAIYVKGQLKTAIADACRKAGVKLPADGGTLAVKFVSEEPASTKGFNPKKIYAARYTAPPAKATAADAFLGTSDDTAPF